MNIVIGLLTVILVVVCLLMVLIVMMQRPKQEGLGAAFGGGITDHLLGAQTTNVLQKGTVYLAVMFFGITLLLSVLVARKQNRAAALGSDLSDGKTEVVPEGAPAGDAGTGAQLLSELPLTSGTETPSTPAATEGTATTEGAAAGEAATEGTESATPAEGTPTETAVETEATPSESAPSSIDDAAPLPESTETPAAEAPATEEEAPAESTDAAGETPNL